MRRRIPVLAAIAIAAGLAVAAAHDHRMGPPPPHGLMPQIAQALHDLDLSSEQKETIHRMLESRHSAMQARQDQAKAAHGTLRTAILAEPFDEGAVRNAAAAIASFVTNGAVADAMLLRGIRAELNADQRDDLTEILSRPPLPPDGGPYHQRHHHGAKDN